MNLLKWRVSPFGLLLMSLALDYVILARLAREVRATVQSGGFAVDALCRFLVSVGVVETAVACFLVSGFIARFSLPKKSEARIWSVFILACSFTFGFLFWVVHSIVRGLPLITGISF